MVNEDDVLPDCPPDMAHMRPTYRDLRQALAQIKELREENERLRAPLRPSLEVLQRMANGLDPFDRGRFQAAMAALPHETPKLTATMNHNTNRNYGDPLDRYNRENRENPELLRQRRLEAEQRQWRVIEGDPAA